MAIGTFHSSLSPLIQASLSPVFMLTAISATLAVIDTRQNRIVDRARLLEAQILARTDQGARTEAELKFYLRRSRHMGWAAVMCILSALSVAAAVVTLFIDAQTPFTLAILIEGTFTCAVLFFVLALMIYLRDVFLVNRAMSFVYERLVSASQAGDGRPG